MVSDCWESSLFVEEWLGDIAGGRGKPGRFRVFQFIGWVICLLACSCWGRGLRFVWLLTLWFPLLFSVFSFLVVIFLVFLNLVIFFKLLFSRPVLSSFPSFPSLSFPFIPIPIPIPSRLPSTIPPITLHLSAPPYLFNYFLSYHIA